MRVLVTGGTGKTGRRVATRLRGLGHEPAIASRAGTDGVSFDWGDPATYASAAHAVDAAYLVAPSGALDLLPAMRPFIETLLGAGVGRLVLLSAASLAIGGPMMGAVHAWLAEHAPCWTVLRPSWFMQNFSEQQHRETIVTEDRIYSAAGGGGVGWIDAEDIAAVAAAVLADCERGNGELVLTGPETLSYDDVAARIGQVVGRPIAHWPLSVEQLATRFEAAGMPAGYARALASMDGAVGAGSADYVTTEVAGVTGEPANAFERFAAENVGAWRRA